jgi:Domain of unknown function (DUF1905)
MTKKPSDPVHCWLVWRKAREAASDYLCTGIEETGTSDTDFRVLGILRVREVCNMRSALNKSFSAKLQKSHRGGWTYVVWPNSVRFFGTRGLVKVSGTIDGLPFKSSFMAMGDGRHMLPVKVEIRRAIGKEVGKTVKVVLEKRMRTN